MLTPEQITALRDAAGQICDPVTEYLLQDIAERIAAAGQLTSTASYEIWKLQQLGMSQRAIKKQLRKLLGVSHRDLRRLLTQAAEVGYNFDIKRLPQVQAISFAQNSTVQQIVSAAAQLAQDDFTNITQTLGLIDPHGNALPLQDAYRSCMDFAFKQVSTGAADYNTAIRQATKNLAREGLQTIDYESGVSTKLDAAVRRSVMGGLGLMQEQITQANHDAMGCDGWEISAHAASAPDHEPIQGRQYSDAAYTALNNSLVRRIGTLNCGHAAFPIILGVSSPQYTAEELEQFRQENAAGIDYQRKHYTGYEATQMQRHVESSIRNQRRQILVDEATGSDSLQNDQIRLVRLNDEYARFSKAAGLRTQAERLEVSGFGPRQEKSAASAYQNFEFIENDAVQKAASGLPAKLAGLPNEEIAHTVNVSLPKISGVVPKGATATDVYIMAGSGTSTPIRDLKRLYAQYPELGSAKGWVKKSGTVYSQYHHYVVHWYENGGNVPAEEIKLKGAK